MNPNNEFLRPITIVVEYRGDATLASLPRVYIKSIEDAVRANSHNDEVLEEIERDMKSIEALIHNLRWNNKNRGEFV